MPLNNGAANALAIFIRQALQDAKGLAKTDRIRGAIQMQDAHFVGPNRVEASLFVLLKDAPEARAYELGSGLHGEFQRKYPIAAKNVPNLVFWWEREKKWFVGPELPIGHPGVTASPALHPAMIQNLPLLRREVKAMVRQEIVATIRNNFRQVFRGRL